MNRYEISGVLGTGTTSTVYRARDLLLDRPVALKEIELESGLEVALSEARAAARISHPNVVTIHDVTDEDGRALIAMELLEGPTLRQVLQEQRCLSPEHAVQIGWQMIGALAAAHARDVVHCDVKPDNIFLERNGRLVVSDFGLAGPALHGGTPGYMAPEQWRGEPAHASVDVFAWACVMTECVSGEPPFGLDPCESEDRTLHGEPVVALGPLLNPLALRCLAKDPRHRPADGSVLAGAFGAALQSAPDAVTAPSPWSRPKVRSARADPSGKPRAAGKGVRLVVYPPSGAAWVTDLPVGQEVEVGREAELCILDPMASRRHARLRCTPRGLEVVDLGSLNGTWRNSQQVQQVVAEVGDVLTIGSTVIRLEEV